MTPARLSALLAGLCLWTAAAATPPARLVDRQAAASLWVTFPAKGPLELSDEATVTLRVEAPAPLDVEPLDKVKSTPAWTLEEKGPPVTRAGRDKGGVVWEQEYVLTPWQPGEHAIELPPLRYRSGAGEWHKVAWKPLTLRVRTQVKKAEPGSARDITPPEEVPGGAARHGWLLWAGLGLGAVLLGVTGLVVRRRRALKEPAPPPHRWALRELDRLAGRAPASAAEVEAYHTALAAVVRRYLEMRFHLPAERRTTPEFLEAVRGSSDLPARQQQALAELLARCDLAKFARVRPSSEECQAVVTQARAFVQATASSGVRSQ